MLKRICSNISLLMKTFTKKYFEIYLVLSISDATNDATLKSFSKTLSNFASRFLIAHKKLKISSRNNCITGQLLFCIF